MRLLIDAVAATTGGGATRIRELARYLPKIAPEHEYIFVVSTVHAPAVRELAPQAKVVSPPSFVSNVPARLAWEYGALPLIARRLGVDVVLAPFGVAPTAWPRPRPKLAAIVSNLCPYSDIVCGLYRGRPRMRRRALRWLTDLTLRRADHVFLLSEQAYSLIAPHLLRDKSELIPMAPPTVQPNRSPGGRGEPPRPYVIVVTDLSRFKGIEMIPGALALMEEQERPDVMICGRVLEPDYVEAVRADAIRQGVSERLQLLGSLPHDEALNLMSNANVCLIPSRFENPGRVGPEALALGVPVLASDVPSAREMCGDAAIYFRVDDVQHLAQQIERLINDEQLRRRITSIGQSRLAKAGPADAVKQILAALERYPSPT